MSWKLVSWAVAALIPQGILDFMTDPSLKFIDPTATVYQLQSSLGIAVLAFWIVFSTVAAPLVIQKVFTYGALAGGELIGGAVGSFVQTADTTTRAMARATSFKLVMRHFTLPTIETRRWMAAEACGLRWAWRIKAIRLSASRLFSSWNDTVFIE